MTYEKNNFCQYCGAKILIEDDTKHYEYRAVDEARIREAEARENIRSREIELEKERLQNEKEKKDNIVKIIVAVVIIYLICYIIGGEVEWLARTAIIWTGIVLAIRGIRKKN
nr:hypothetical protein [uncultured Mediterraneibacter sp.]